MTGCMAGGKSYPVPYTVTMKGAGPYSSVSPWEWSASVDGSGQVRRSYLCLAPQLRTFLWPSPFYFKLHALNASGNLTSFRQCDLPKFLALLTAWPPSC